MLLWQSLFDRFWEVGGRRSSPLPH
jgi:hypothetical protein